jgi:hypothetical protein
LLSSPGHMPQLLRIKDAVLPARIWSLRHVHVWHAAGESRRKHSRGDAGRRYGAETTRGTPRGARGVCRCSGGAPSHTGRGTRAPCRRAYKLIHSTPLSTNPAHFLFVIVQNWLSRHQCVGTAGQQLDMCRGVPGALARGGAGHAGGEPAWRDGSASPGEFFRSHR